MKRLDLIGLKFSKLTVVSMSGTTVDGKTRWACVCDCGGTCIATGTALKSGIKQSCGCMSKKFFIDLTGQKFNKLTLVKHLGKNKNKNNIYEALCECGKSIVCEGSDVKMGKIVSCGCLKYKHFQDKKNLDPDAAIINSIYGDYRNKARKRGYVFNITFDFFRKLVESVCHYCGKEPSNVRKHRDGRTVIINGVDRVDNSVGYEDHNVVPCCAFCNQAKHTMTKETFLDWIKSVYEFQTRGKK